MNHGTRVQPVQDRHLVAVIRGDDRGGKCTPLISTVYILNESQHICWFYQNTEKIIGIINSVSTKNLYSVTFLHSERKKSQNDEYQ